MSKPYTWEQEDYPDKQRKRKPRKRKAAGFWRAPLLFSALCYVLLLLRKPMLALLFTEARDNVTALMQMELYGYYMFFALLLLPLFVCALFYIKVTVFAPMWERAELTRPADSPNEEDRRRIYKQRFQLYVQKKSKRWRSHAFFYILFALQLTLLVQNTVFGGASREATLLYSDVNLLRSGDIPVYEGKFHSTERPLHNIYGYVMIPDENFYYFNSDLGTLRCLKNNLSSSALMQSSYSVEYLPGTCTVVSITTADGILLTGPDGPSAARLPAGAWLYGDLIVESCTNVYGYELLTEGGQKAFDLMYGEYYSQAVARGEEPTHSFALPEPISKQEYLRVLSLYQAATAWYSRPPWRYDTNDTYDNRNGQIQTVYAGGIRYGDEGMAGQYFAAQAKAAQIVADMPKDLSDTEKCAWLAQYLAENVHYYTEAKPQTDFVDSNGITLHVAIPEGDHTTAYGALVAGSANADSYSAAFAALAQEAGIKCIIVRGTTQEKAHTWNMVSIEGGWYHVDITLMDRGDTVDEAYFLADDAQISLTHTPVSYGECEFVPLPPSP